jgi:2-polyprenyl-3-methyl-5-hydroxy-6-metoxy-1,4-benzoquinol methylase
MLNEAKMLHPDMKFTVLDMIYLEDLPDNETYDVIIFIASFHHIDNEYNRKKVLKSTKSLLNPGGVIMMTHWNLMGEGNFMKYQSGYK